MNDIYVDKSLFEYSDEQLALLVKEGNYDAYSALVKRYLPYIKLKATSFHALGFEDKDFVQEGLLSLFVCAGAYNESRNTSFKTFTEACILRRMISLYRSANSNKNIPLNMYMSLDDYETDIPMVNSDPEQQLIDDEGLFELRKRIESLLSEFEHNVLNNYLTGNSYDEIARLLNTTPKAVDNAMQRVRGKLRNLMNL